MDSSFENVFIDLERINDNKSLDAIEIVNDIEKAN